MDIRVSKDIGVAFAVCAEVAGTLDVLIAKAKDAGSVEALGKLSNAQAAIRDAGAHFLEDMQGLSGEAFRAATNAAASRMAGEV